MSSLIIFDDGRGRLGPMVDLRASFEVRTGMLTTAGRLAQLRPKSLAGYWVPEHLLRIVASRADAPVNELPREEEFFCVNGRWAIPDGALDLPVGTAAVEDATGHVVAARLRRADAEYFLRTGELHERAVLRHLGRRVLYRFPWDVLAMLPEALTHDIDATRVLDAKVPGESVTIIGGHPVQIDRTARVWPNVVFDATVGPIMVQAEVVVRPGAVICGPCSIGYGSTVSDHALIKANTAIGPVCKVGGEVGGTIFQGYANKVHDGHLGDSWVGKWVNIGAGTTNSNLLNTYGDISMRLEADGPRHRTGLTFLGAIIGDHVKLAIGTRIMTGTVIGTGAMVSTTAPPPATVRRFAWLTDAGERRYHYDKFMASTAMMMQRRDKVPSPEYQELLRTVYDARGAE